MADLNISREALLTNTIEMMNVDVPNISNKTAIHQVFKGHFRRSDPDLYSLFDAFFYSIIEAVCNHMEAKGIKQPNMQDFIKAFRHINGISMNVGNLQVHNYVPADYEERIIESVMKKIDRKYMGNVLVNDGEAVKVEIKDKKKVESEKEEIEDDLDKYEDLVENIDEDELVGEDNGVNTG